MTQVILRRSDRATHSAAEAVALVQACPAGQVLHHSGDNLLVEVEAGEVAGLQARLPGWVVAPQGAPIQVPDTRRTIRSQDPT